MIICKEKDCWEYSQYIDEEREKASRQTMNFDEADFVRITESSFVNPQVALLRRGRKYGLFTAYHTAGMGGPGTWRNPFRDPFPFDEIKFYANMFDDVIPSVFACRIGNRWGAIEVVDGEADTDEQYEVEYPMAKSRKIINFNQKSFSALKAKVGLLSWGEFGNEQYVVERKMMYKENYLELKVPGITEEKWLATLHAAVESEFGKECVHWKRGHYHITVAFFKDDSHVGELKKTFGQILHDSEDPELTFDKVDVFQTRDGKEFIINLTASQPSADFTTFVGKLREAARKTGAEMKPDFRLHVTLGRIAAGDVAMGDLKGVVDSIEVPSFTLTLNEAEYRYRPNPKICYYKVRKKHLQCGYRIEL